MDTSVTFDLRPPAPKTSPTVLGRPKKTSDNSGKSIKRQLANECLQSNSSRQLVHAASLQFRKESDRDSAKVLKMISEDPNSSGKIVNAMKTVFKGEENKATPMNPEDSLKFLIDHN